MSHAAHDMDDASGRDGRSRHILRVVDLGTMDYGNVLALQRAAARARIDGSLPDDTLILVEHPPVITLGRSNKGGTLLVDRESLAAEGVELFEVERGGEATYHGPGQLVGYPIMHLERHRPDLHWYLRRLESVLIAALLRLGLPAVQKPGQTGVWTLGMAQPHAEPGSALQGPSGAVSGIHGRPQALRLGTQHGAPASTRLYPGQPPVPRKIASIGVHARSWVTWHGFALNVSTDLRPFDFIIPCGIDGVQMTSLSRELGRNVGMEDVRSQVVVAMEAAFGLTAEAWTADSLPPAEVASSR